MKVDEQKRSHGSFTSPKHPGTLLLGLLSVFLISLIMFYSVPLGLGVGALGVLGWFLGRNTMASWFNTFSTAMGHSAPSNNSAVPPNATLGPEPDSHTPKPDAKQSVPPPASGRSNSPQPPV